MAEAFRPTLLVTQNGADAHSYDPLSNLELTTAGMHRAVRLMDDISHRYTRDRWLATGGGGYDVYRVVPRTWSLVWLAQAHRDVPAETPRAWRERWADEAARYGQAPPPVRMLDPEGTGSAESPRVAASNRETAAIALERTLQVLHDRPG